MLNLLLLHSTSTSTGIYFYQLMKTSTTLFVVAIHHAHRHTSPTLRTTTHTRLGTGTFVHFASPALRLMLNFDPSLIDLLPHPPISARLQSTRTNADNINLPIIGMRCLILSHLNPAVLPICPPTIHPIISLCSSLALHASAHKCLPATLARHVDPARRTAAIIYSTQLSNNYRI